MAVAQELRSMNHQCMTQLFDMQTEIAQLKSVQGLPFDLIKVLRRGYNRNKNNLLSCFDPGRGTSEDAVRKIRPKVRGDRSNKR